MNIIYADYNIYHNSIDICTYAGYILRIDCAKAEEGLKTTPNSECALNALAIDNPLEYARLYLDAESTGSEDFLNDISIEAVDQAGNLILEGVSGDSSYIDGKNKYINLVSEKDLYQDGNKIDTDKIEYVKIIPVKLTEGGSVAKRYKDKAIIVNLK